MSQALIAEKTHSYHAPAGSRALSGSRVLSTPHPAGPRPAGAPAPRTRTPLSVVPARPAKRRIPFVVFSFVALVAALVTVLMLNISVSGTQYELVQLRGQQIALSQENQALEQKIENREAPQNLAAAATELGMVASPTFGSIEIDSLKVTGTPEAATKTDGPRALIPAPHSDLQLDAKPDTAAQTGTEAPGGTIPGPEQAATDG
ncbi:hypothetical protein [Arthrobacter sp. Br18]|uniref:hypothetical protein n=1 Tax=Arthrobacter sp. Br18 TaxID=1312954 RepID=UPI000684B56D|nr:hypothetical protein [Arthrobacter sp. Br18]